jgi:SAM-dependent methyltransferase
MVGGDDLAQTNNAVWERGSFVASYAHRTLNPVEVLMLVRHREEFSKRVLELGCGAGRITGYLVDIAEHATGLDLSERMVQECRRRYPRGTFVPGDMRDLSAFADGSLDAVLAGNNVIDVFSDAERRATLREIRRVLRPGGLFVMSSHNRAHLPHVPRPTEVRRGSPVRLLLDLARVPRNVARHRRLAPLEQDRPDYAIVSDGSHGFTLAHYYVLPADQVRQLEQEGFSVIGCADLDGRMLGEGETAPGCSEIHYFARPAGSAG